MRLIDADALLKKKREMELCFAVTEWDIEDAPTIDPESLAEYLRRLGYEVKKCQH